MRRLICGLVLASVLFSCASTNISASAQEENVYLPVVMYHSILNSKKGVYIVSEAQLKNDLRALKKRGYNFVFPSEVIAYAAGESKLPDNPVMITFDDGHYNNMYYGLPILISEGAKAEINIVGKFSEYSTVSGDSDNPNYSHLTWEEIAQLEESGVFEIGNHSYAMHDYKPRFGVSQKYGETDDEYRAALINDIQRLQQKLYEATGKYPITFAYPFGKYTDIARDVLLNNGFKMLLTCNEGVSKITFGKPESLYYVKRFNRSGDYSTYQLLQKIDKGLEKAKK